MNLTHELEYRGKKVLDSFSKHIIICGCGAIGSNLAENLVRQGFTNFGLVDFDRVEAQNLNTQAYSIVDLGRLKVQSLASILYEVADEIDIVEYNIKLENKNVNKVLKNADLVIDTFDNTESRKLLKNWGIENKKPVLHAGLFEDYGEVIWNEKYNVPKMTESLDICDYPLARNIVMLTTVVLTEEIIKWCIGKDKNSFSITLKDLRIKPI